MKKFILLFSVTILAASTGRVAAQTINTIAGNGTGGYTIDGIPATTSEVNGPAGVAVDPAGNVYFTDYNNNRIRKVDGAGIITTIAGNGTAGHGGDGGPATAATIAMPFGICLGHDGSIYFSDREYNSVRKIDPTGTISLYAGVYGTPAYGGDSGPATLAHLSSPRGLALDNDGNLYIADEQNCRIRKVTPAGTISTICGNGIAAGIGDGGAAAAAEVQYPYGVAIDGANNIYIADYGDNRIRKIDGTTGIITTIAGHVGFGSYGFTGDGGLATASKVYYPEGIAVDAVGNVYVADYQNVRIRKITISTGDINTVVGSGPTGTGATFAFGGDGGPATNASLGGCTGVAVDATGFIYLVDASNNRVRKVATYLHAPYFVGGHSLALTVCENTPASFDSSMSIVDVDTGQVETWSLLVSPIHGSTPLTTTSAFSTGGPIHTTGLTYTPTTGYLGLDSFKVRINDGTYSDTAEIYVNVIAPPNASVITGADSVCPGRTLALTDTATGGTWISTNTAKATVSVSGLVSGLVAGTDTVLYVVSNYCGSDSAKMVLHIHWSPGCPSSVANVSGSSAEGIDVSPNPSTGAFSIVFHSNFMADVDVEITNSLGEKVKAFRTSANKIEEVILQQPTGVYFVAATVNGIRYNTRVLLTR